MAILRFSGHNLVLGQGIGILFTTGNQTFVDVDGTTTLMESHLLDSESYTTTIRDSLLSHWPQITRLAERLEVEKTLTGREAFAVLEGGTN